MKRFLKIVVDLLRGLCHRIRTMKRKVTYKVSNPTNKLPPGVCLVTGCFVVFQLLLHMKGGGFFSGRKI